MSDRVRYLVGERRNLTNPDARMQPGRGTLVTNDDGSQSVRAPSPEEVHAAGDAHSVDPDSLESYRAEARMYGLDPDQYGTDYETLGNHVRRERPRFAQRMEPGPDGQPKYAPDYENPATFKFDEKTQRYVPESYRFRPSAAMQAQTEAYKHRVRAKEDRRAISDRFQGRIGPEYGKKLDAMVAAGRRDLLRAEKESLASRQRDDANKNIADAAKNRHITRNLNSPDLAPGFIVRSTQGIAPHDRAALYTVLGWEPAATRETQAGIAQDAYNSQMAMASQQGGATENPDDNTVAGQTKRHMSMIARMLDSADDNDINTAVNQAANFHVQANQLPLPEAQRRANEEVSDMLIRRGGIHASTPLARTRMANMARGPLDAFVSWAATVGWSPEQARAEYDRLRGKSNPPATASSGVNPITGR